MKIDLVHLTKRFFYALDFRPLQQEQIVTAKSVLSEPEFMLWSSMRLGDKRHSLKVLARFSALLPQASVANAAQFCCTMSANCRATSAF